MTPACPAGPARHKRALVIVGLIVATAFSFWFFSRYPDLDHKAQMAQAASSIGDISPWPVVSVDAQSPFVTRWALTTLNWVHANLRGMSFGLAIAAMVLTLIGYFPNLRRGGGRGRTAPSVWPSACRSGCA